MVRDRKAVLLYDGQCPLCRKSVRLLRRMDTLGRLEFADARDPGQWPRCGVELDAGRLLEEMHLVTPDGKVVYTGFDAFRWAAARVPLLWGVWPVLFAPGVPWLGRRAYRWVARNRFGLVPCEHGACAIHAGKAVA
jgi:predicted DCC family thiol-disulfide oxidoreductase YuxK